MPRSLLTSLLLSLPLAGCFIPQDTQPQVGLGARIADKFVHRGMTMVNRQVLQPHLDVVFDTVVENSALGIRAEANMDLKNNVGAAWFPDGHAGRFTQMEYIVDWSQKVGDFDLRGGIHNYNLPNGLEFPNGERGGTTEAFVTASTEVLETTPYLSIHYDFDEVRSTYVRAGVVEGFELAENLLLEVDASLGYAGGAQSSWMYGINEAGFADLRGSVLLSYGYDDRTSIDAGLHGSMMVDSTIEGWFKQLGIDDDPWWVSLGVTFSF
ncbi:MAG: hypothetical protein NXI31_26675 [bacterium]|nr:hypothetical protein [bacterium]